MITPGLYSLIVDFIQEKYTPQQLEEKIVPDLPRYIKFPQSDDANIVSAVELCLAEWDNHNITENDFRNFLNDALKEHEIKISFNRNASPDYSISSSSNKNIVRQWSISPQRQFNLP